MAVNIPFPLPATGYALNSKVRVNLDFLVAQFNEFNSGTATWDQVSVGTANSLTGSITLYNASNANYVTIRPGVTASSHTYTLPLALPASTGLLQSDSSGTLSWATSFTAASVTSTSFLFGAGTAATPSIRASDNLDTGLYYVVSGTVLALSHEGTRFFGKESGGVFLEGIPNFTGSSLIYSTGGYLAELPNAQGTESILSIASSQTPKAKKLLPTTNQTAVTFNTNDVTIGTVQDIGTSSTVQFGSLRVGAGLSSACAIRLNAANTGLYMSSASIMAFAIAGTDYATLDNSGAWFITGEMRAPTVRTTGSMKFSNGAGSVVTIQSLGTSFGDYTLTLPPDDGTSGYVLRTDGSGVLTWVSVSAAGGATAALDNLVGVAINTTLVSDTNNTDDLGTSSIRWKTGYYATSLDVSATTNQIVLGTTRTVTLTAPTPATTSRTVTIPDLSASYSIVGTEGAQTVNGNKTLSGTTNLSALSASLPLQLDGSKNIVSVAIDLSTTQRTGTLNVANGGTANTTFTAYAVLCAGTTATGAFQNVSGLGSSGNVLTSNGAGALPTWQAATGTGTVNTGTVGRLALYPATGTTVDDVYVQNSQNIDILIAAQASRSAALEITFPNPGNAITAANVLLSEGDQSIAGVQTFNGVIRVPLGSNTAAGISFVGDANTGMYSNGADSINFTAGGTQMFQLTGTNIYPLKTVSNIDGTNSAPSYGFDNDPNTGMYRVGNDDLGFTVGGTVRLEITTSNVILTLVPKFGGTNSTGAGTALLGSNSPASTLTSPYTWISALSSDGSTVYIPCWK